MIYKEKDPPSSFFTRIAQTVTRDKNLSLSELGLYCALSALPPDWDVSASGIRSIHGGSVGEIRKCLAGLIEKGYLKREKRREGGRFCGVDYRLYDFPHAVKPECGLPERGLPERGLPEREKRTQYNNIIYKKEKIKERNNKGPSAGDYGDVEF